MHITKHAAELCALLVNDLYGELPSRVLASLFRKGRSSAHHIAEDTALTLREIRHGLAVLLQHNLLYYQIEQASHTAAYEANGQACYNLIRHGKILAVVEKEHGATERAVVQKILMCGHAKVSDLERTLNLPKTASASFVCVDGEDPDDAGVSHPETRQNETADSLQNILAKLVMQDILEPVGPWTFESTDAIHHRVLEEVTKVRPGEKATGTKAEQQEEIQRRLRKFADRSKWLRKHLTASTSSLKRRKLASGNGVNILDYQDNHPIIDGHVVLRVNKEKCLVELRNRELSNFAAELLGEVTGQVYHTLLRLLTVDLSHCRPDPRIRDDDGDSMAIYGPTVSTSDLVDQLDDSVDVHFGLGRGSSIKIDNALAEKLSRSDAIDDADSLASDSDEATMPAHLSTVGNNQGESSDSDDIHNAYGDERRQQGKAGTVANGARQLRVKFDDGRTPKQTRFTAIRQHLLLLAENRHHFVHQCGQGRSDSWAVDFELVVKSLQEAEVDAVIEQSFGRHGLRLTRILRDKGKIDDKELPHLAMMRKTDVQTAMLSMQIAGFVDVQEVPRGANHKARDVIHLRFFDLERTQNLLLDDLYKAMIRCFQILALQRHRERNILLFVDRKDVRGKEAEVMKPAHFDQYVNFLGVQSRLLSQVMRLDDMVAILRDY